MIAAMYLRKSRAEEQEPIQETLARHKEALYSLAKTNKITVAAVYEEVASGDNLYGRPEMLRLMSELDMYEAVLCMDIDRLGRGAMHEQGLIMETLKNANVMIVTPSKTYNLNDDVDDSLISFKALFAREEYKLIKGRLRRGVLKTVKDGGYVSNAPFGYVKTRIDKRPTLEINAHEAAAVRIIFDMYCDGNGCQVIADALHSMGYRPHRGDKFNRTSIAKIIRNPVYIGKVAWNQCTFKRPKRPGEKHSRTLNPEAEWLVVDGNHEGIIDEEKFKRANTILDGKYHPPYRKTDDLKNPLSGILHCGKCGRSMTRQSFYTKPNKPTIILCNTRGCCMASNQDIVEQIFFTTLQFALNELKTYEPDNKIDNQFDYDYDIVISAAKAELTKLNTQLGSLHDLLERGIYNVDTFISRQEKLLERIKAAEQIIKNSARPLEKNVLIEKLETVTSAYWKGTPSERNNLIKELVGRAEYFKPKGSSWKSLPTIRIISWSKNL